MSALAEALHTVSVVLAVGSCPATEGTVQRLSAALPAGERDRAGQLPATRRAEFVAGRVLVRDLLAQILNCRPAEVPIAIAPAGRPQASPGAGRPVGVSLSHSGGLVAAAVSWHTDIGVDIEPADRLPAAVTWSCSAAEQAWLRSVPQYGRPEAFTRLWTRKEACVKALGTGIRQRLAAVHCGPGQAGRWRDVAWREVIVAPGYAGAVAVRAASELTVHLLPTNWSMS